MSEAESKVEVAENAENGDSDGDADAEDYSPEFPGLVGVALPLVPLTTHEEDEAELCNLRARLYRYDMQDHEWKERGTGNIKLLHHTEKNTVRVVMRRDKTMKICANHFITPNIEMVQHMNSERAFNWTTFGDYADEVLKQEFLAVRFGNADNAKIWKAKFEEGQEIVRTKCTLFDTSEVERSNDSISSDVSSSQDSSDDEASNLDSSKENILEKSKEKSIEVSKEIVNDKKISEDVITKLTELSVENNENKPPNVA